MKDNKLLFNDVCVILDMTFDIAIENKFEDRYQIYKDLRDLIMKSYTDYSDVNIDEV